MQSCVWLIHRFDVYWGFFVSKKKKQGKNTHTHMYFNHKYGINCYTKTRNLEKNTSATKCYVVCDCFKCFASTVDFIFTKTCLLGYFSRSLFEFFSFGSSLAFEEIDGSTSPIALPIFFIAFQQTTMEKKIQLLNHWDMPWTRIKKKSMHQQTSNRSII